MKFFNFIKRREKDNFSQSGQDQFAFNLSGYDGHYLEIGAHHPIINSNTYKLETHCNWKGLSIENDISFKKSWDSCQERKNKVIWNDAFSIDYSEIIKINNFSNKFNYLSCDIEPPENTFKILEKIISSKLSFDFISFEHDKYNVGDKYEKLSVDFLRDNNYNIAVRDVYSRNKINKIYETWFVNDKINFEEITYSLWKSRFYKNNSFNI